MEVSNAMLTILLPSATRQRYPEWWRGDMGRKPPFRIAEAF